MQIQPWLAALFDPLWFHQEHEFRYRRQDLWPPQEIDPWQDDDPQPWNSQVSLWQSYQEKCFQDYIFHCRVYACSVFKKETFSLVRPKVSRLQSWKRVSQGGYFFQSLPPKSYPGMMISDSVLVIRFLLIQCYPSISKVLLVSVNFWLLEMQNICEANFMTWQYEPMQMKLGRLEKL